MRRGLVVAVVAALAYVVLAVATHGGPTAVAQSGSGAAGGGAGESGIDWNAGGELLPDGSGAGVDAGFTGSRQGASMGGRPTGTSATRLGGSGGSAGAPTITCSLWPLDVSPSGFGNPEPTTEALTALWDRRAPGTTTLQVMRVCYDASSYIVSAEQTTWAPAEPGAPPLPLIDPAILAAAAESRLAFPSPLPRARPALETGTYAQFPTTFWVEGTSSASASASAGPVTATVTARPVSQTWEIRDGLRGGGESIACEIAGPPAAGTGESCAWTPSHSSAGQATTGGAANEPCFPATVTVTWDVDWTANVPGAGGALGTGTSATDVCVVVAEVQAVVAGAG